MGSPGGGHRPGPASPGFHPVSRQCHRPVAVEVLGVQSLWHWYHARCLPQLINPNISLCIFFSSSLFTDQNNLLFFFFLEENLYVRSNRRFVVRKTKQQVHYTACGTVSVLPMSITKYFLLDGSMAVIRTSGHNHKE